MPGPNVQMQAPNTPVFGPTLKIKFESHSARVKSVTFHPKLSLLAAALHNGTIQLWNFQMGTLVDRFEDHKGPVRGLSFHPNRPLLASSGDDHKIRIWNFKERRKVFALEGHMDYVRTVFFHHDLPWIISASDDQTIRIWNIESRQCLAVLTGHNHYVMCAQFHPKEDLIISASMDQSVRVWDFSGLRKKHSASAPMSIEEQIARATTAGGADHFGSMDVIVKYILEGHDRGVNWVSWHPTLPLIVSAGDDRQIKIWRLSETKAWEVDTCRGHFNNICCALFHPKRDLILSDAEDKTIRIWDLHKRTCLQTFKREADRFWILNSHPTLNLFAAGHDSGLIVFKLERERPAYSVHMNTLFYIRDKKLRQYDLNTSTDTPLLSVAQLGNAYTQPLTLNYNPAERSVLVTHAANGGQYDIATLPRDGGADLKDTANVGKRGSGKSAIFVARNRFAVLDHAAQTILVRDLLNTLIKTIPCPAPVNEIFYGGPNTVLLSTANAVMLFDLQQEKAIGEIPILACKYVAWNTDGSKIALLSKHSIVVADKSLAMQASVHETIRIKSATWDEHGTLLYSTLNHLKYLIDQGDHGIIKTLEQPVYLVRAKGKTVTALDRSATPVTIQIDPSEYRFKTALIKQNYEEVLQIIKSSNLVGQSIIAYLQKKGYPELALHFIQDKQIRFDLAIECANLDVALEMARSLNREENWPKLAQQALKQGNHRIVELAYQKVKDYDRLSFLYLVTGNQEKLAKMQKIAAHRGDQMSQFHNALYCGDVEGRIEILRSVGMHQLAYMTAKSNGLEDLASEILTAAGKTEAEIAQKMPRINVKANGPPKALVQTHQYNWPSQTVNESYFDQALAHEELESGFDNMALEPTDPDNLDNWSADPEAVSANDTTMAVDVGDAWDLDEPDLVAADTQDEHVSSMQIADFNPDTAVIAEAGITESDMWIRNSPLAVDHIAAGNFETAMTIFQKQAGITQFRDLKKSFQAIYRASHLYFPAIPNLPSLKVGLRRSSTEAESHRVLPLGILSIQQIVSTNVTGALKLFGAAKLSEAVEAFRSILHSLLFVVASTEDDLNLVQETLDYCREYIIALNLALERKRLLAEEPTNVKRQLEVTAYFAYCKLHPEYRRLAYRQAMTTFHKAGNFASAALFARNLLELSPPAAHAQQAQTIVAAGERNPRDNVSCDFNQRADFVICAASLTAIYQGSDSVADPFCHAQYLPQYSGSICQVTQISQIGMAVSGLRHRS